VRSCLVSNLVTPLLDRLYDLLNNGSLGNLSNWGESIGTGLWETETSAGIGHRGDSYGSNSIPCRDDGGSCGSKNTGENDLNENKKKNHEQILLKFEILFITYELIHDVLPTVDGMELIQNQTTQIT
jgi:hypothetical protein